MYGQARSLVFGSSGGWSGSLGLLLLWEPSPSSSLQYALLEAAVEPEPEEFRLEQFSEALVLLEPFEAGIVCAELWAPSIGASVSAR